MEELGGVVIETEWLGANTPHRVTLDDARIKPLRGKEYFPMVPALPVVLDLVDNWIAA